MDEPTKPVGTLRCAGCGEPVVYRPGPRIYMHASTSVAACDLDSDHVPSPDWEALGEVVCARCGADCRARGGHFGHCDEALDGEHPARPELPLHFGPPPVAG